MAEFILSLVLFVVLVIALTLIGAYLYIRRLRYRLLTGESGEEAKWAAELVQEGDDEFAEAMRKLPPEFLAQLGYLADDKDELRELVVTYYEEIDRQLKNRDQNA